VAESHRRVLRSGDVRNQLAGVRRSDRFANVRSIGLSSWVRHSLSPLLSGGCLLPFDLHRQGLNKLAPWLIVQEITHISFSSSLLRTWLASLPESLRFPALRFVGATGERLYAQDVIRLTRHLEGDWRIGHSYSSTESGTIAAQVFTPLRLPDAGIVSAGHPVDGAEVYITDEAGALVPAGEIGEIIVRSRFLSQGYWNNPELTAKVFQTDMLDSAVRIYRTGDLGRWRSDGTLEHLGRKGRRIRLRGYNVEPFEVECALMRQPGVMDAVVVLHEGSAGEEPCLVGYVVAPTSTSASIIRQSLAAHLPSYLVPSHIVVLDSFPVTGSGKLDRTALPPPQREKARTVAFRAPTNDRERELCAIWQEVLKISKIGVDDDFFELGGTSLQVLTVFARIAARLECSLSPTTIVQAPTIARLAEFIRPTRGTVGSQSLVLLRASGMGPPLFLVKPGYYGVMHYRHLLKDLRRDRPVFGLQPLPLDGKHRVPRTIELMAADYVTEIRGVQPHGPYFIAGYSFGGRVSFEIAQQLVRAGELVSFLGMVDTTFHDQSVDGRSWVPEVVLLSHKVRRVSSLQDLLHPGLGFIWRKMRYLLWAVWIRLLDLWFRMGRSIPYEQRMAYYDWMSNRANQSYVVKPYPGHITMFTSAGNSERQQARWGPVAGGGLTVLEVPAEHGHMASPPHSKLLADYFNVCLDANARPIHPPIPDMR
jgi:thioesterase domain-containing protein